MYIRFLIVFMALFSLISTDGYSYRRGRTESTPAARQVKTSAPVEVEEEIVDEQVSDPSTVNTTTNPSDIAFILECQNNYKEDVLEYCDMNPQMCMKRSTVELLMDIEASMLEAECKAIPLTSKTMSVEEGLAVFKRCDKMYGVYDLEAKRCAFTIELRKGKKKQKLMETAVVYEGVEHTCGKELFPKTAKKKTGNVAVTAAASAVGGAIAGGLISQEMTKKSNLEKHLKKYCNVSNKNILKKVSKEAMNQKKLTVDILQKNGVPNPQGCLNAVITAAARSNVDQVENMLYVFSSKSIYFKTDEPNDYKLSDDQKSQLDSVLGMLKGSDIKVVIAGHTDTTATDEYNKKLGERRANAVKTYFADNGVKDDQMKVISKGENNQLIPTSNNVSEKMNRRVDIVVNYNSELPTSALKGDFKKGAIIGGVSGAALGTGFGLIVSKERYNCYIQGRDDIIAGWNDEFTLPKKK